MDWNIHFLFSLFLVFSFFFLFPSLLCRGGNSKKLKHWPIIGMLPSIIWNKQCLLDFATAVLSEYKDYTFVLEGPWFTGLRYLVTCHPANAKHILNANSANYSNGVEFAEIFDILGNGILTTADKESWAFQRSIVVAHMSTPKFQSVVVKCTRDKLSNVLLPLLNQTANLNKVINLSDLFMRLTTDTGCISFLGVDPGYLAPELPRLMFAEAVDEIEDIMLLRHIEPKLWWKLLRWLKVGKEKRMAEAWVVVDQFLTQYIQANKDSRYVQVSNENPLPSDSDPQVQANTLTSCMSHIIDHYNGDEKIIRDFTLTLLVASIDTTAVALSWFFWLIANNPNVENKIIEELKEIQAMRKACRAHTNLGHEKMTLFDVEETNAMVYLQAALFETLRLFPTVPFSHKEASKEDTLPSGHHLQPGAQVILLTYSIGRMEGIWGKDCKEFKPERWIDSSENRKLKHEPSYKFLSFLSGNRACIGKTMALTQLKLLSAAVIYNFHIELVQGHAVEPKLSMILRMKNGLMVTVKKRVCIDGNEHGNFAAI